MYYYIVLRLDTKAEDSNAWLRTCKNSFKGSINFTRQKQVQYMVSGGKLIQKGEQRGRVAQQGSKIQEDI